MNTLSHIYFQKSFDYFLKGLNLDSDEDEMRIDYIREAREKDENNNDVSLSSRASLNLMQNIHFAELDNEDIQLSDSYLHKSDKSNDFLPKIEILEIDKSMEKSESSLNERLYTLSDRKSDQGKLKDSYLSSVHSEYQRSETESGKSRESNTTTSTSKGRHYSSLTSSSTNIKSKSSKSISNSSSTKTLSKSSSSDGANWRSVEKSEKSESGTLSETSDILSASASSRTSSKSTKSGKSTHKKKKSRRRNEAEKIYIKDNAAQTDFQDIDYTEQVLNFKYNWQSSEPSRIASHVIDATTLDMLTNYSPAMLAANDMMKFHLDLMKKYIDSSRRLYEAYSSIDSTSSFRYTTIEDTMNYIKKNRPRVTNYEDALEHVTKESSR